MNKINLTAEQQNALKIFTDFINDPAAKYLTLSGLAGTGKTTLVLFLYYQLYKFYKAKQLLTHKEEPYAVRFAALTHKAASAFFQVIQQHLQTIESDIQQELFTNLRHVTTLHRLCGVTVKHNYTTGEAYLKQTRTFDNIFMQHGNVTYYPTYLFIDEASMISEELFEILDQFTTNNFKVIFIGDPYQLPPVEKNKRRKQFSVFELPTVHKITLVTPQRSNGILTEYAIKTREKVITRNKSTILKHTQQSILCTQAEWQQKIKTDWGIAESVALAWTNKQVDKLNKQIRSNLGLPTEFVVGDRLILNNTLLFKAPYRTVLSGKYVEILDKQPTTIPYADNGSTIHGYLCQIRINGMIQNNIFVPEDYQQVFALKKQFAKQKKWTDYYTIEQEWAHLVFPYAMTIHKAQGQEWDKVFLDLTDLQQCHDEDTYNRLLYVGLTRARKQLIINQQTCLGNALEL